MALPPKYNQIISPVEASKLTGKYREQAEIGAIKGGLFWKEYVQKLLDQPGCVALRYYYALDDKGNPTIVLVGVDGDGNDMTNGIILEISPFCPPICSISNSLNT
ncbi:MAG: hypothetical protein C0417_11000 [Chlorobiaceae bacterium]|nr:hypothetical protein [Chlorobiaceae bacterium]